MKRIFAAVACWGCLSALVPAWAQSYPARAITVVTPFAAGNAPDVLVRAFAQELTRSTGKPVIVDSRPGGGTLLAAQAVAKAAPDGYTVLVTGITTFASNRHLYRKLPYDPVKDFAPVTAVANGASVLLVNSARVPVHSVAELLAYAKARPGQLTIGDATSTTRVLGSLLQRAGGIELTRVPYRSSTQAIPDLIGGQLDMLFTDLTALRYLKDGRVRALAVDDKARSPLVPELPTLVESGLKGLELGFLLQAVVPARTPEPVIARLRELLMAAGQAAEVRTVYADTGMQPVFTTPAELRAINEAEAARWAKLVPALGLEVQ